MMQARADGWASAATFELCLRPRLPRETPSPEPPRAAEDSATTSRAEGHGIGGISRGRRLPAEVRKAAASRRTPRKMPG
jgi:hypothetical protein